MFKHVYFGLVLGSTLLGAVGLVQSFHTQGVTQKIAGTIGIGGAATALTALGLGIAYKSKEDTLESDFKTKLEDNNKLKDRELTGLKLQIDELKSQIKALETDKINHVQQIGSLQERLNNKSEEYLRIVCEKDLQIKSLQTVVDQRDTRIADFLEESRTKAIALLQTRYNSIQNIKKSLQDGIDDGRTPESLVEQNLGRINDFARLQAEIQDAIAEVKDMEIKCFNDVLIYLFRFDDNYMRVRLRWKDIQSQGHKAQVSHLEASLKNTMPLDIAKQRFREGIDEVDDRITEKYETLLINNNNIHAQLLDLLEEKNLIIDDLRKQNDELSKPLQAQGSHSIAVVANKVSNFYYEQLGYKLDFINWTESDVGYDITYATRQNNALTNDELMVGNAKEQLAKHTGCLQGTFPEFTYDYRNCTVILSVVLRKPVKKEQVKGDIDKIWIPVDKFESYVKNWERVRITAGSTGGKSPTAKNLALAVMKQRKGQGEIRLYDPQDGSKKDYWDMPKSGITHADNVTGMEELCDLLDQRSKSKVNHSFVLYIFDEVDSTIAQERENNGYYYFRDKVTYSLKQASHQNIGAIYIGQACDASTIPGMSWSDWNNAVQIHIGANAGIWINKATTIDSEAKTKLLEQYAKIQEFCDRKNEELGLDIFTDPGAYRFALAVPLTGLPKFIQLPDFDTYDYYNVMGDGTTPNPSELISSVLDEVTEQVSNSDTVATVEANVSCPHCGSTNFKKHSRVTNAAKYRYSCLNVECKKTFVADRLTNSN